MLPTQGTTASTIPRQSAARVLIVDDEQNMCDICARTLRRAGYEVATTNDPREAVTLLRETPSFDLLLTDIKMPTMSGFDLAYIARDVDPAIAIIIMTGFASMENLQQSVQRGVADLLAKPFELDQLRLAVDQALHKRTLLQDNIRLHAIAQLLAHSERLNATLDQSQIASLLLTIGLEHANCQSGAVLLAESPETFQVGAALPADFTLTAAGTNAVIQLLAGNHPQQLPQHVVAHADQRALVYALLVPLRAQGDVIGVLLLGSDAPIVRRLAVQESLELLATSAGAALRNAMLYHQVEDALRRLQELDRLKSEFIAIASHELRTPLSIIMGYTSMLRDQQTSDRRDYVRRVMTSAQRIKDIVDDMVSLRHLETGEVTLTADVCDLRLVATAAADRVDEIAQSRHQTLVRELPDAGHVFTCDYERLLLVIGHLLSNAIKFTPEGGTVTLCAAALDTAALPTDDLVWIVPINPAVSTRWAVFQVIDSGIGIVESEQQRVFERFYQVADSLTRDHGGTGLGLAVVRELIQTLGGGLWLRSIPRAGSTFGIALPYV
jgi:signal transduction histidine kinase